MLNMKSETCGQQGFYLGSMLGANIIIFVYILLHVMSYDFICVCFLIEDHMGWRKLRDHTILWIEWEQIIIRGNLVLRILYLVCISISAVYVSLYDTIYTCLAKSHWSRQRLIINLIQQTKYKISVLKIQVMCLFDVNNVICNSWMCIYCWRFEHS